VRGFDWSNKVLFTRSNLILMHRPLEDWYASIRKKQIGEKSINNIINPFCKKSFIYWIDTAYRMNVVLSSVMHSSNLYKLSLYEFQENTEQCITKISERYGLKPDKKLSQLMFLGIKFNGHSHSRDLNRGVIMPLMNKKNDGMSFFEKKVVLMLENYNLSSKVDMRSEIYSTLRLFSAIFHQSNFINSSFTNTFSIKTFLKDTTINLKLFFYMTLTIVALKSKNLIKLLLHRRNKHINTMSIWKI
jgi:hypothetical protein